MRLRTDTSLRQTLYGLYVALFEARQASPKDFGWSRLTTIHTAIMSVTNDSWRVIGITKEALELLAVHDFDKKRILPRSLCRGHRNPRVETVKELFDRERPMLIDEFFELFLKNDCTVIMLSSQNKTKIPDFIPIDNPDAVMFPNGHAGWKDRSEDYKFLRQLHLDQPENHGDSFGGLGIVGN